LSALLIICIINALVTTLYTIKNQDIGGQKVMTLEFEEAIKVLDEHIDILKQNLLFLMAEHNPENMTQVITDNSELDKSVQEKMKLSRIYCHPLVVTS
jgi:hypothetical protein